MKVIGIGQPKTGTTSLGRAFRDLGLAHATWDTRLVNELMEGELAHILAAADKFDSFEDLPWSHPYVFPLLDERYLGSKFILTTRDPDSWLKSLKAHFTTERTAEQYRIQDFEDKADNLRQAFIERDSAIQEYFADRKDDLLIIRVCDGEGWEKLCPFLGVDVPNTPFPHMNRS